MMENRHTLEKLFELAVRLGDEMERGLRERRLTRARAEVLWLLHRGGPQAQHALSQALCCTPRNVTGLVDALETTGFVVRGEHPTDRRATLVSLTEQGQSVLTQVDADYQRFSGGLFANLPDADVACFAAVLEQVLARLSPDTPASCAERTRAGA